MIEIGKSKTVKVREKKHGKFVFKLDADGNPETKVISAEVVRCTRNELDGHYGRDRGRRLVVRLKAGDVIEMWPMGTRQRYTAELKSVFSWMVRGAAAKATLEKARATRTPIEWDGYTPPVPAQGLGVREFLDYDVAELRERIVANPDLEALAWRLTAAAVKLVDGVGAFRAPAGEASVYLIVKSIARSRPAV
jgi:cobalamin-dependent methionine synthase I